MVGKTELDFVMYILTSFKSPDKEGSSTRPIMPEVLRFILINCQLSTVYGQKFHRTKGPHDFARGRQMFLNQFTTPDKSTLYNWYPRQKYPCTIGTPDKSTPVQLVPQTKVLLAIQSLIATNGLRNVLFDVICSHTE